MARDALGRVISQIEWLLIYRYEEDFEPEPAEVATGALCGSQEKIEVMRLRVLMGESCFHPLDETRQIRPSQVQPEPSGPGIRVMGQLFSRRKSLKD